MFVIITMWSWFVNCSGYRRFLVVAIGFSYNSYCRSFHFNFLLILLFSDSNCGQCSTGKNEKCDSQSCLTIISGFR